MTPAPDPLFDEDDFDPDLSQARAAASAADCDGCRAAAAVPVRAPVPPRNAPGQPALNYRLGTHPVFFATMIDGLSADASAPPGTFRPLDGLTSRRADDFSIALLDAAALVFDVVAFYLERIANENYLRTATERLSVE